VQSLVRSTLNQKIPFLTKKLGTTSVFFTYPLEVIRVRMAFHTRNLNQSSASSRPTFSHAARYIYHEGAGISNSSASITHILYRFPILKFYRGFTVTVSWHDTLRWDIFPELGLPPLTTPSSIKGRPQRGNANS
jgi:hypothetical protein